LLYLILKDLLLDVEASNFFANGGWSLESRSWYRIQQTEVLMRHLSSAVVTGFSPAYADPSAPFRAGYKHRRYWSAHFPSTSDAIHLTVTLGCFTHYPAQFTPCATHMAPSLI
jgi:hypothetical protein